MAKSEKEKLYLDLRKAFGDANVGMKHGTCDLKVSSIWQNLKTCDTFPGNVKKEISKWQLKAEENKLGIRKFWITSIEKSKSDNVTRSCTTNQSTTESTAKTAASTDVGGTDQFKNSTSQASVKSNSTRTPAQDDLKAKILIMEQEVNLLSTKRDNNMASDEDVVQLRKKREHLSEMKKALASLVSDVERQRRKRENERRILAENPELAAKLRRKSKPGRPPLEDLQPELLETIAEIATYGGAADERRRSETIRSVKTIKELTAELNSRGYQISESGTYLRLLPRNQNTREGKRHINTVPVRLIRATNDKHREHADTMFCKASISYLEQVASILGPSEVVFISQDDKARVPLGISAANKQAPLLMHLDYRVRLPDHDWVVAEKHKLIPSVYGIMCIKENAWDSMAVTYSGPTFITVRSGKHCSSTASTHARDFDEMVNEGEFAEYLKREDGQLKPNLILSVDGGPDENPRYEKVINEAIVHFKKYDLDTIFIATNAPGRSAFNRIERRMAPLSRELGGVILPHDNFGSHLDQNGKTIDIDLEKQNFEHAGQLLAEIWGTMTFDGYPTIASYVKPEESERSDHDIDLPDENWRQRHIREGHYFLQIIKCQDLECCGAPRGSYFNVFPRFLPAPMCLSQTGSGLIPSDNSDNSNNFTSLLLRLRLNDEPHRNTHGELPFDYCCPSIKALIPSRTCSSCGIYFASLKSMKSHKRHCLLRHPTLDDGNVPSMLQLAGRTRPIRVAARRQREKMVIWTTRLNDEHVDWIPGEYVEGVRVEESEEVVEPGSLPIVSVKHLMETRSRWENV